MQKLGTKVGSKIFIKGYQKTGKKVAGQVYGNDNVNVTLSVISYQQVLKEDLEKLKAANLIELLKDNKYTRINGLISDILCEMTGKCEIPAHKKSPCGCGGK